MDRKCTILALFLALVLAMPVPVHAQQFAHINTGNSGLSYDGISCIMQDSRGFVWIGTYKGLNRYDGFRFDVYYKEQLGLPSDFIFNLDEDDEGNIWVGTDAGVSIYKYAKDSFEPLLQVSNRGETIHNKVTFISASAGDGLVHMLVNDQGYFAYDTMTGKLSETTYRESGAAGARRLLPIKGGGLGVSLFHNNLYRSDVDLDNLQPVPRLEDYFRGDEIERMFPSQDGAFFVASTQKGLVRVDPSRGDASVLASLPGDAVLNDAFRDADGRFWLSTTRGVWMYDPASGERVSIDGDPFDRFSVSSNYTTCTYVDRNGGIWVGTLGSGVNYCGVFQSRIEKQYMVDGRSASGFGISAFAEDSSGRIWVATQHAGLLVYDPSAHSTSFYSRFQVPSGISSLCVDGDDLWIGTLDGLYKLDTHSGRFRNYGVLHVSPSRNDPRVYVLFRTGHGDLYAGTTAGLFRYDRREDRFETLSGFVGIFITSMAEDSKGNLWLSSYANGLYEIDNKYVPGAQEGICNYRYGDDSALPADKLSSVFVDASDAIWAVGFSSGIAILKPGGERFSIYDKSNVKAFPSNVFFKAVSDLSGHVWLSSDQGLVRFSPEDGSTSVYKERDGLLDSKLSNCGLRSRTGDMYFGSDNGFIRFRPWDLDSLSDSTRVALSSMRIGARTVRKDSNLNLLEKFEFGPDDNSFGFSLSFLGGAYPSSNRVQSRLKGYDQDWKDVPPSRSVYFYSVPPGEYELEFRSALQSGEWVVSRNPVRITVRRPFFQTIGGVVILIAIIAVMFLLIGILLRFFERRRQERENAEYRKAKDEEMFQEKLNFFSHVIHEIKTPLTLIKAPLADVMSKDSFDEGTRKDLKVMNDSTDYLSGLVNELLDFVRIEKKGYVLNPERIDLLSKLHSLVFDYDGMARDANVRLSLGSSVDVAYVTADSAALDKILNNLLGNAVKYAGSYADISVSVSGSDVVVEFSNDGQTIPDEYRETIFKPFVQYRDGARVYSNGVGIGLPLSRNLAAMQSGSLVLDPRKDITCFRLSLPAAEAETGQGGTIARPEQAPSERPCILLAEDNKELAAYMVSKLAEYDVFTAGNGDEAMDILKKRNIDILISDISMPGKSGLELCRDVRADIEISHLPIIIISARSSVESKIQAIEAGSDLYIEKPFDMEYLRASVRGTLERRELMKKAFGNGLVGTDISMFGLPRKDEEFFGRFDALVRDNLDNSELSNDFLAEKLNMSASTLTRKIRKMLNTSPNKYIQATRISVAAAMLKDSHGNNVSEISYAVGFASVSYFAKCFKDQFGVTPTEYIGK